MIMGSRVRFRLGAPFDILCFVRNLLFLFSKILSLMLMTGVILTFLSTRVVEGFSIHTHMVSGSTPVVQVTVYFSWRIIPVWFFFFGGGGVLTLYNVCSVHQGVISTSGGYH